MYSKYDPQSPMGRMSSFHPTHLRMGFQLSGKWWVGLLILRTVQLGVERQQQMSVFESSSKFGTSSKKTSVFESTINRNSSLNHEKDLKFVGEGGEDAITFNYRHGITYTLINRDIKLRNDSTTHIIRFKIQSNNPSHYKVHPSTAEIHPNKTIEIVIQINGLDEVAEIGPNFFAKFASDKFKLSWYSYRDTEKHFVSNKTSVKFAECKRIFRVHINIDEDHAAEEEVRKKPIELGQKVSETLQIHKKELVRLQGLIQLKEIEKVDESCLTCHLIMVLAVIAFFIGVGFPLN